MRSLLIAAVAALAAVSLTAAPAARAQLEPGDAAPDFSAPAAIGGRSFDFSLSRALENGPVVLYFFPKAFTRGCTIEANRFAEAHDDYAALGATVIGISGDDIDTLREFSVRECRNRFAVASDANHRIMKAYDAQMPLVLTYARRISYVISSEGRIVYTYSSGSPDGHVPNTLDALRSIANGKR